MKFYKKVLLLFVFLIGNILASVSQELIPNADISLFEYKIVDKSEDNFKNLFRNFPIYIENGNDIDFLSYEFIATIKSKRQIKRYVKRNFKNLLSSGWSTSWSSNNDKATESSIRFRAFPTFEVRKILKKELGHITKVIVEECVGLGYELYVINFAHELKKYSQYVFINPDTKKVVLEGNIFGVKVPSTHFEYVDGQNK